jgi:hypothetical protein
MNITMVDPFAWSSGMAIVLIANPSRQPLCNWLVEGADKGFYFVNWSSHRPPSRNRPLGAIAIALAALTIAPILAHHPCRHRHCPLHRCCCCLPANLVTVSIALPPSPSLSLTTLIAATVIAAAITLVVACPAPSLPLPLLLPPLPSPSSLLASLVAIGIAPFAASAFTCPPPLLPLCHLGWGRGGPYPSGAQSYSAATIGATIIIATFDTRATGWEGPVQQRVGFQHPADSLRRCGGAAISIHVAGVILLGDQRQWRQRQRQRADGGSGDGVGNATIK